MLNIKKQYCIVWQQEALLSEFFNVPRKSRIIYFYFVFFFIHGNKDTHHLNYCVKFSSEIRKELFVAATLLLFTAWALKETQSYRWLSYESLSATYGLCFHKISAYNRSTMFLIFSKSVRWPIIFPKNLKTISRQEYKYFLFQHVV